MYRDLSTDLDERDRAVGAILMGEALVDGCERAVARAGGESTPPPERWRAIAHVHDAYLDIWRHLDQARRVLADRGANTMAYDELRPNVRRAATNPGLDGERAVDCDALEDARRAIGELKLAVPGADWDAIDARTQGLVNAPLGHRAKHRLAL
ncbi:MAG TPA: hypothetical protein VLX92_04310, partial [Kofleriaceae bacterium]|nr:hypothetical protein [Kofleriaceae bacterium]